MTIAYPDFDYADGNGNLFSVTQTKLSYKPITKEMSSSGFYSGGEPKVVSLTFLQKKKLEKAFQKMTKAPSNELEKDRLKGTGVLKFKTQEEEKIFIFQHNSPLKESFEKLLHSFLTE